MNSTLYDTTQSDTQPATFDQAVVATYLTHDAAEAAVCLLSSDGVPMTHISVIGRHFETREQAGEFLVVVHGATAAQTERASSVLQDTGQVQRQTHSTFRGGAPIHNKPIYHGRAVSAMGNRK